MGANRQETSIAQSRLRRAAEQGAGADRLQRQGTSQFFMVVRVSRSFSSLLAAAQLGRWAASFRQYTMLKLMAASTVELGKLQLPEDAMPDLRAILLPPPVPSDQVDALVTILAQFEQSTETTRANAITAFNTVTGRDLPHADIVAALEAMDIPEFAESVLRPPAPRIPDISRAELLELIQRVQGCGYDIGETGYWIQLLEANLPHPNIADLIFNSRTPKKPEEILAEAQSYTPDKCVSKR